MLQKATYWQMSNFYIINKGDNLNGGLQCIEGCMNKIILNNSMEGEILKQKPLLNGCFCTNCIHYAFFDSSSASHSSFMFDFSILIYYLIFLQIIQFLNIYCGDCCIDFYFSNIACQPNLVSSNWSSSSRDYKNFLCSHCPIVNIVFELLALKNHLPIIY